MYYRHRLLNHAQLQRRSPFTDCSLLAPGLTKELEMYYFEQLDKKCKDYKVEKLPLDDGKGGHPYIARFFPCT